LNAIGVLLAFLVVAMLAVGLSSRPSQQRASTRDSQPARPALGGTVYLLALPDANEAPAQVALVENQYLLPCEQPCYAYGCGWDRTTGVVYSVQPTQSQPSLQPAAIVVAANPNSFQPQDSRDCRSHYDRLYDAAVYGDGPAGDAPPSGWLGDSSSDHDDPTLQLFYSLSGRQPASRAQRTLRLKSAWYWQEMRPIARGVVNQLSLAATRWGLNNRWERLAAVIRPEPVETVPAGPSWADYEDWIASLQPGVAARDTQSAGIGTWLDQPWRQVLQIAVSWLNHAAKTLDTMSERLSGRDPPGNDRVGVRTSQDAPR
jgi:hypothetical protein